MKLKSGFEIKSVENVNIVVPVGNNMSFSGVITLNDTALFVWNLLKNEISMEEIVAKMAEEYDAPSDIIAEDVKELISSFKNSGLLEE